MIPTTSLDLTEIDHLLPLLAISLTLFRKQWTCWTTILQSSSTSPDTTPTASALTTP